MAGDKYLLTRRDQNNSQGASVVDGEMLRYIPGPPPLRATRKSIQDNVDFVREGDIGYEEYTHPTSASEMKYFKMEPNQSVHPYQLFLHLMGIIFTLVAMFSNIKVAISYYTDSYILIFLCAVVLILINGLLVTGFSIWWYWIDAHVYKAINIPQKRNVVHVIAGVILHLLLLAPVFRSAELLYHTHMVRRLNPSPKRNKHYTLMIFDSADVGWLKIVTASCESAPLLLLQLYLLLNSAPHDWDVTLAWRVLAANLCWFSFCLTMGTYHRALRLSRVEKCKMSLMALFVYILWKMLTVGPRFLILALFASIFHWWVFVVLGLHWFLMFVVVRTQKTKFCSVSYSTSSQDHPVKEFIFNLLLGWIYNFDYICAREGRNRMRYLLYYSLMYVENVAMLFLWYNNSDCVKCFPAFIDLPSVRFYVKLSMVILVAGVWWIGIAVMIFYYLYLHPTKAIPVWVPLSLLGVPHYISCFSKKDRSQQAFDHSQKKTLNSNA